MPKDDSWINMAEIEINIMDKQCTGRRIESKKKFMSDLKIWVKERNKNKKSIEWKFTRQDADEKLPNHCVA